MTKADRWAAGGYTIDEGLRLLEEIAPSPWLDRLVRAAPSRFGIMLRHKLMPFTTKGGYRDPETAALLDNYKSGFRKHWPWLGDNTCPSELKILAADMITAYYGYVEAHGELYDCTTLEECFETAKKVVKNLLQNRLIRAEFEYYSEHGSVLGKHPIFAERKKIEALRSLPLSGLIQRRDNLRKNVYRIEGQLRSGDRPDLAGAREERLASARKELEEIKRLMDAYGATGKKE